VTNGGVHVPVVRCFFYQTETGEWGGCQARGSAGGTRRGSVEHRRVGRGRHDPECHPGGPGGFVVFRRCADWHPTHAAEGRQWRLAPPSEARPGGGGGMSVPAFRPAQPAVVAGSANPRVVAVLDRGCNGRHPRAGDWQRGWEGDEQERPRGQPDRPPPRLSTRAIIRRLRPRRLVYRAGRGTLGQIGRGRSPALQPRPPARQVACSRRAPDLIRAPQRPHVV